MYNALSKCAISLQVFEKNGNDDETSNEAEDHTSNEPPMQKEKMKVWKHS
jgi:hypothetical protein